MRAYQVVLQRVERDHQARRKSWLIPVAIGAAIAAGAWFGLASRRDDLQSVLMVLGGCIAAAGIAMLVSTFRSPASHKLVSVLRDDIDSVIGLTVFNVIRNNAFVAIRMEFQLKGGGRMVYAPPRQTGEAWLAALYAERPDLAGGAR